MVIGEIGAMQPVRYGVVVADPPWLFADRLPGSRRGAARHYPCLEAREIAAVLRHELYALHADLAPDCYLFLWRVAALVPEAYWICEQWGFRSKTEIVWAKHTASGKRHFGMGHHVRASHETAIIATRGSPRPQSHSVRSLFAAPVGEHSAKPDRFYELVEELHPGPYLELFARRRRPGWTCVGLEVDGRLPAAAVAL